MTELEISYEPRDAHDNEIDASISRWHYELAAEPSLGLAAQANHKTMADYWHGKSKRGWRTRVTDSFVKVQVEEYIRKFKEVNP